MLRRADARPRTPPMTTTRAMEPMRRRSFTGAAAGTCDQTDRVACMPTRQGPLRAPAALMQCTRSPLRPHVGQAVDSCRAERTPAPSLGDPSSATKPVDSCQLADGHRSSAGTPPYRTITVLLPEAFERRSRWSPAGHRRSAGFRLLLRGPASGAFSLRGSRALSCRCAALSPGRLCRLPISLTESTTTGRQRLATHQPEGASERGCCSLLQHMPVAGTNARAAPHTPASAPMRRRRSRTEPTSKAITASTTPLRAQPESAVRPPRCGTATGSACAAGFPWQWCAGAAAVQWTHTVRWTRELPSCSRRGLTRLASGDCATRRRGPVACRPRHPRTMAAWPAALMG